MVEKKNYLCFILYESNDSHETKTDLQRLKSIHGENTYLYTAIFREYFNLYIISMIIYFDGWSEKES